MRECFGSREGEISQRREEGLVSCSSSASSSRAVSERPPTPSKASRTPPPRCRPTFSALCYARSHDLCYAISRPTSAEAIRRAASTTPAVHKA